MEFGAVDECLGLYARGEFMNDGNVVGIVDSAVDCRRHDPLRLQDRAEVDEDFLPLFEIVDHGMFEQEDHGIRSWFLSLCVCTSRMRASRERVG